MQPGVRTPCTHHEHGMRICGVQGVKNKHTLVPAPRAASCAARSCLTHTNQSGQSKRTGLLLSSFFCSKVSVCFYPRQVVVLHPAFTCPSNSLDVPAADTELFFPFLLRGPRLDTPHAPHRKSTRGYWSWSIIPHDTQIYDQCPVIKAVTF